MKLLLDIDLLNLKFKMKILFNVIFVDIKEINVNVEMKYIKKLINK